ncbi:hypothetical protein DFH09DRAFT_1158258 [Mycena vulgaris]|nr:hypothetical protein DFH09DRAFT_1158258 [Mycena vulgaris]
MDDGTIELAHQTILLNDLHLLGISILFWDHLITLGNEIKFVWLRKRSVSSIWFYAVRYIGFAGNLPVLLFSFKTISPKVCNQYSFLHQIVLVVTQFLVSLIMILRTYALYDRDTRVLVFLVSIGVCLLAVCSWAVHDQQAIPVTIFPGCHQGVTKSNGYHLSATWAALFLFDSIIFGLTMRKIYSTRIRMGSGELLPLHMLIVRDGALYFGAMALANLGNIITYYLGGPLTRGSLSTFANCVSISLMSRLMLNLHEKTDVGILSFRDSQFEESLPMNFRDPSEYPPLPPSEYPPPQEPEPELEPEPEPGDIAVVPRVSHV